MEIIKSHKTQLSEENLGYQSELRLKQAEIEKQQKRLKYITTKYQETKQQVCIYMRKYVFTVSIVCTYVPTYMYVFVHHLY